MKISKLLTFNSKDIKCYKEKLKFYLTAKKIAKEENVDIKRKEIFEIYEDIDTKFSYINLLIEAEKSNTQINTEQAQKFFTAGKDKNFFKTFVSTYIKAKKAKLNITPDEILQLFKQDKNIEKIVNAAIHAKKQGVNINIEDIKTVFYAGNDNQKIIKEYIKNKKNGQNVSVNQISNTYFKNINTEKYINIKTIFARQNLEIDDEIIFEMLDKNLNIIKAAIILSEAKKQCTQKLTETLETEPETAKKLANTYVIKGKEKFKKELDNFFIKSKIMKDPAELYLSLVKAPDDAFKYNYEIIKPYLLFDFKSDVDIIINNYLKARRAGLHIKLQQIAELAEKEVDIKLFIEAEINNK